MKNVLYPWRTRPLENIVIEELAKRGGSATSNELMDALKDLGVEATISELLSVLMKLEMRGVVVVNRVRNEYLISFSEKYVEENIE
ncbi:MAG: hypothetical protein N3E36_02460 [Sulfolobales archaeon]|nr:hypothetical protein [Sulfolobales archaeon]